MTPHVIQEYLGIHEVSVQIFVIDCEAVQLGRQFSAGSLQVDRFQVLAGTRGVGLVTLQDLVDNPGREATGGLAQVALHHVDDTVGKGHVGVGRFDLVAAQPLADHHQRHVANDLGAGRDLDDIAEHLVHVGIGLGDLVPPVLQPQTARLGLEIGELATGHFVQIDLGGRGLEPAFKRRVLAAHAFPIIRNVAHRRHVDAGVAIGVAQGFDDGPQAGL